MAIAETNDLRRYCVETAQRAHRASFELGTVPTEQKQQWLARSARLLRERHADLIAANERDLADARANGLTDAQIDRLRLTPARLEDLAAAVEEVATLADPVGEVIETSTRPNGLRVDKIRVPLGVVFFIYESRPNVTIDAAAICVKSGNAVILRGGKEARHSNQALAELLREALVETGLPVDAVQLVETTDRAAVGHFLGLDQYIDLAIPRGGEGLIRRVAAEARMPVIKHFTGNCHLYVDRAADLDMAETIAINAKCQRMGVCNAAESLLVHADVAAEFLPRIGAALAARGVEIRGDERVCELVPGAVEATEEDWGAEYLAPIISANVVASLDEAIERINRYGSHHTDAIITRDEVAARRFTARVDSSAVVVNASTRFNDGGCIGLGAEIGISTDKFHARGPCGLKELTSYKYVIVGDGQIRQ
ncbi:MAG: glutamate-5-semialdehyde dehydrogenase [Pirellulales bacterium]|nr:glutamate-5-semialdehyde dehydrogenase [Pirellulales bacterium]